ncbi:hypothetical protein VUR80DRAFT_10235 [Thermomyces stellatus]
MAPNTDASTRIIAHMNKDHRPELSRYLQHFARVPSHRASDPVLTSLSLESMTIRTADGAEHVIPFDPPMKSYAEARKRAVEMDAAAREGLGLGDVDVGEFLPPWGLGLFSFTAVALYIACCLSLPWQVPGSPLYSFWDAVFPGGARMQEWVVRAIRLPVLGIHLLEALHLDRTRLAKYGVRRGSGVWWAWMCSCFIEGFPAFRRFDGLVQQKREAKGKAQ